MPVRAVLVLLLCAGSIGRADARRDQAPSARATFGLTDPVPVDPAITIGTLPNGLRYYVQATDIAPKRATIRLVVKAGSVLEEDDQRGIAQFLTQLASNGTARVPKDRLAPLLASKPMIRMTGADYEDSRFTVGIDTDDADQLQTALTYLADVPIGISFDPVVVEEERIVALKRLDMPGAPQEMEYKGSRHAERSPTGAKATFEHLRLDRVRRFYTDWYRPDLMAIIAVGDFDRGAIVEQLRTHFASIPAPSAPTSSPEFVVAELPEPVVSVHTLPGTNSLGLQVGLDVAAPRRVTRSVADFKGHVIDRLVASLLSSRFAENHTGSGSPFDDLLPSTVSLGRRWLRPTFSINIRAKTGRVADTLDVMVTEFVRASTFGFGPAECERHKRTLQAAAMAAVGRAPRAARPSLRDVDLDMLMNSLERHFRYSTPLINPTQDVQLLRQLLPDVTLPEINDVARSLARGIVGVSVFVFGPTPEGGTVPTAPQLEATLRTARSRTLTPYVDAGDPEALITSSSTHTSAAIRQLVDRAALNSGETARPNTPGDTTLTDTASWLNSLSSASGTVVSERTHDVAGTTEWRLSNGATVVVKPTVFKTDEIVVRADSWGGSSLASGPEAVAARAADEIVNASGYGSLSRLDLDRFLAGRAIRIWPFINELDHGVFGSSSVAEVETLFQLIVMAFTQPRATVAGRERVIDQHVQLDTLSVFSRALDGALSQNHLRAQHLTADAIRKADMGQSLSFYRDRFADASAFTFVLVGNVDLATLRPLVERYLASLPTLERRERPTDLGIRPPKGVIAISVESDVRDRGEFAIAFTGPFENSQTARVELRALARVLDTRVNKLIGKDLAQILPGLWSGVMPSTTRVPYDGYELTARFDVPAARVDELVAATLREVDNLRTAGPSEAEVTEARDWLIREDRTNLQSNSYLVNQISLRYQAGEDLTTLFQLEEFYNRLTPAAIRAAALKYLDTNNYVKVTRGGSKK